MKMGFVHNEYGWALARRTSVAAGSSGFKFMRSWGGGKLRELCHLGAPVNAYLMDGLVFHPDHIPISHPVFSLQL